MSFTLRLTADLAFSFVARALTRGDGSLPVLYVSADTDFDPASDSFIANIAQIADEFPRLPVAAPRRRSPIIWVGGPEPLDYPGVARLSNSLAASPRHVFLETSGASLKPRLHEFQPSSRFYFVIRFDAHTESRTERIAWDAAFRPGLEALRMARLAGFFICANLVFHQDTSPGAMENLHSEICKLDVDGFLITPSTRTPELQANVRQARRRLVDRRWALLSSLLDSAASLAPSITSRNSEHQPIPETQPESLGESAEAG